MNDLSGQKFSHLTAVKDSGQRKNRKLVWECLCDCGNVALACSTELRAGKKRSCGCQRNELMRKHGYAPGSGERSRAYKIWACMNQRCQNPNNTGYVDYGGRGIFVCEEWQASFSAFLEDMGHPPAGMSLERKNNSEGYSKHNCIWATYQQQANNTRRNVIVSTSDGEWTMAEYSRRTGIPYSRIKSVMRRGKTVVGGVDVSFRKRGCDT